MKIINANNLNQARKQIQLLKKENKPVIVQAQSPEFNRKVVENSDVDIILGLESHNRKDFMKQRDSGLNEILAKLAKQNKIKIGINLQEINKLPAKQKAIILMRIKQNISLCKRTKTQIIIYPKNNLNKQDITSFFLSLGANTQQAKQASEQTNLT